MKIRKWIKRVCFVITLAIVMIYTSFNYADALVVVDPTNLVQNTMQVIQEGQNYLRLLDQIDNQIEQLENDRRNLEKIMHDSSNLTLEDVNYLRSVLNSINSVAYTAGQVISSYNTIYNKFSDGLSPMSESQVVPMRNRGRLATEEANIYSMSVQADIMDRSISDTNRVSALIDRSNNAEGNLGATQVSNEFLAQVVKQQIRTQQLLSAQHRLESSRIAEEQSKEYQQEAYSRQAFSSFGTTPVSTAPLSSFPFAY